ncbi:MAG: outer membrane protein transport protein [Kiritimatiellae bacterium]|nr:outer membrane protein transport protein [Kiritimatiellia bacterium]
MKRPHGRCERRDAGQAPARRRLACLAALCAAAVLSAATRAYAEKFTIVVPGGGSIVVEISHVGPSGDLVTPSAPETPAFGPPTIFSAPLPSGSGARALGIAGAFTAIADDATAASWNPGGLIQLERPEASAVFRAGHEQDRHRSADESFQVGDDSFGNVSLNYFSGVLPFRAAGRNCVFSANYQEAYDFTQQFTADLTETSARHVQRTVTRTDTETKTEHYADGGVELDVTSRLTTRTTSALSQMLDANMVTALEFEQEGIIDALSPALAVEITPKFAVGAAVNFYQNSILPGRAIESRTQARYSGESSSRARLATERMTSGTYSYTGVVHWAPPVGDRPIAPAEGVYPDFSDTVSSASQDDTVFDGTYSEKNEYDRLNGINATFGAMWTVSRQLGLGFTIDLPWTAGLRQKRTVKNTVTTYDKTRSRVLDVTESTETRAEDAEFEFPLYWALGMVWRWNDRLYSSLDLSQTAWSQFAYQVDGEQKLNPLDGSPYRESDVDDCWAVRAGLEYLLVLAATEIPLRGGLSWEQRPAIGSPDPYYGLSLGTGVSIGKDPGKLILDLAYLYTQGDDVLGSLVPGQDGMSTDVRKHEVYLSGIWHF